MYTSSDLKIHLSIITSLLKEFSKQEILPKQPEIESAVKAVEKIVEDDLALKLLATYLQDYPKEESEKIAAEAAAKAIEEGIKAAKAASLLVKKSI